MISVTLDRPWLVARLCRPMRILSWAPFGGGWHTGDLVLWREVMNADLPEGFDALSWLAGQVPDPGAVAMLTSRDIGTWAHDLAMVEGVRAECVVTLGLSNAEAVGRRLPAAGPEHGTINLLVATDAALDEAAQIEALSIAVEARTAAVMDLGLALATGRATGTGTDCLAFACPPGALPHAGLHTATGEAVGAAVRRAVARAGARWLREQAAGPAPAGPAGGG